MLCTLCVGQASALEYTMEAPDDYLFGRPTSDDTIYEWEDPNVDRSKNTALIPPGFGTPTSYLPGSGDPLTPNLIPGALDGGGLVSQTGSVNYPVIDTGNGSSSGQNRRLYRRHQRSLLLRRTPGDTQDPGHRPVYQGLRRDRQQHSGKRGRSFPWHQHLGWKLLYCGSQPRSPG